MPITLVQGDITEQKVDAIVNAANFSLLGGGGVDGAIHRHGGPAILEECRKLRASRYGKGLPTGQAVATTAGNLPARWVIHTVGPVYSATEDRSDLLASCYLRSLAIAEDLGARSIAFPAISTDIFGWPMEDSARLTCRTLRMIYIELDVRLVLFSAADLGLCEDAMAKDDRSATDSEIVRVLAAQPAARWRDLFKAVDRITPADLAIRDGYNSSEAVDHLFQELFRVKLSIGFDYSRWMQRHYQKPPENLSVADAARLITVILRDNYWSGGGGVLTERLRDGRLSAALSRLRRWHEEERQ
jgi:O-acetyl-ADP-ribose deacetylase (regulator of RNase III)